ncbi:Rab5-interacting protein-domain-containing protein [Dipodascopsis uninucleata]
MDELERKAALNPLSGESVKHNTKAIYTIRSVTSLIFGVTAGILGLESYYGFVFYLAGTLFVSLLMFIFLANGSPKEYFMTSQEIWTRDAFTGLSSYMLSWTLFYGLVDA